ncbi:Hypothetical protein R9X50_00395100 [Acrodontium crateriforme]|uniref:3'-5' exonuclease domain-containing protein n=1 Tax=Acrodontium crateriforme TaxID=150365 RepID=A0AAQ3R4P0_9PEZI|nr:Hypothetical protein R9X50_00395100 [Acrodontium crateriforme]
MSGNKAFTNIVDGPAAPEAVQRFLSSRSIDHRWDRSRGIIFHGARPSRITSTWMPEQGITFANPPSSPRNYAVRSMDRTRPVTAESTPYTPPSRHPSPHSAPSTTRPGYVKPKIYPKVDVLQEENDEMREELKKLRREHAELDKALQDLRSDHNSTLGAYHKIREALRARNEEFDVAQNQANTKTRQAKEAQEMARIAEDERRSAELAREEIQLQLEKFQRLPIEAEQLRIQAEEILDTAHQLESKLLTKYNQLEHSLHGRTTLLERKLEEKHKTALQLDQEKLETRYGTMYESKIREHQQRKTERHDYTSYRHVFKDLPTVLYHLQKELEILNRGSHTAVKHLNEQSPVKKGITHKPNAQHTAVLDRIEKYLEAQVCDATQRFDALESTLRTTFSLLQRLKSTSHKSRTLTRALHMQPLTDATIAENWYMELNTRPFEELSFRIKSILKKGKISPTVRNALNKEESDIAKLITLHTAIARNTKMRYAAKEPLVEKIAFMQTYNAWENMYQANRVWYSNFTRDELATKDIPSSESDTAFAERGSRLNQDIWDLYEHAMKRALLGEQLGLITKEELDKVNTFFEGGAADASASVLKARKQLVGRTLEIIESRGGRVASQHARRRAGSVAIRKGARVRMETTKPRMSAGWPKTKSESARYTPSFEKTAVRQAQHVFWPSVPHSYNEPAAANDCINDTTYALLQSSGDPPAVLDSGAANSPSPQDALTPPTMSAPELNEHTTRPLPSMEAMTEASIENGDLSASILTVESIAECQNDGLNYQISTEDFRKAVMASPSSDASFWSYTLYKNDRGKKPTLHYCTSLNAAEEQAKKFIGEPVIGFDLEWEMYSSKNGSIKQNVSLIQIAAEEKIALFQIALFKGESIEELMPPSLRQILASDKVVKTGVNISGDARRMKDWLGVEMKGVFELSHLYKIVFFSESEPRKVNRSLVNLARQVKEVLRLPLKKDDVRTSAWSRKLSIAQTTYAGADAYAGFRLYHALDAKRKRMKPTPPRPDFFEKHGPLILGDGTKIPYKAPRLRLAPSQQVTARKASDEEGEEVFFDAEETLDLPEPEPVNVAGVRLAGLNISYPILPSIGDYSSSIAKPDEGDKFKSDAEHPEAEHESGTKTQESTRSASKTSKRTHPKSAEISEADAWVQNWRTSLAPEYNLQCRDSELRAWHLWHKQDMTVSQVAACVGDPPLKQATVASYIMQALKNENLPFTAERINDVVQVLPSSITWRYDKIISQAKTDAS